MLSPGQHSEMLREILVSQCHLPGTQGFPWGTRGDGEISSHLPFIGAGWQHLFEDFGKAPSAGSALPLQQTFLVCALFSLPISCSPQHPTHGQLCVPMCPPGPLTLACHPQAEPLAEPPGIPEPQLPVCSQVLSSDHAGAQSTVVLLNLQPYRNSSTVLRGTSSDATDAGKCVTLQQRCSLCSSLASCSQRMNAQPLQPTPAPTSPSSAFLCTSLNQCQLWAIPFTHSFSCGCFQPCVSELPH